MAFAVAATLAGRWAGFAAAALVGFYPPLILSTGEQLSEPLGALLLTGAFAALALAAADRLRGGYLLAGVFGGLAVLTRADLLLAPFLVAALTALWLGKRPGEGPRRALYAGGAVAGGALLVMGPWVVYASARASEPVPVTRGGGTALFVGTYLPGDGTTVGLKRELGAEARRLDPRLRNTPDLDLSASDVLSVVAARHPGVERGDAIAREGRRHLTRYALGQPIDFAVMGLNKAQRMWSRYARGGARHTNWAIRAWHIVLVLGGIAGLIAGFWRTRDLVLGGVLVTVAYSTLLHMVVVSQARYNLPLMPLIIAGGVGGWWQWRACARRASPLVTSVTHA